MKKITLSIALAIYALVLFAQDVDDVTTNRPVNNVYINILGDASLFSANYERVFFIDPIFALSGKLGLGYNKEFILWTNIKYPDKYLTIPHHITGNIGKRRHFFEFGLGGTFISGNTTQPYLIYPTAGYRFLPLKSNGLNFRIYGQYPLSGFNTEDIFFVPLGLSIGISF